MSAITKERIKLFIKNPLDNGLTRGEQMELARIALTSLEAEPVAWTDEEELRDVKQYGFGEIFQCPPDKYADSRRVIPLYRELPAQVVPEEISMSSSLPLMSDQLMALGYVKGWNACRAAMLQGKGE